MQRKAGNNSHTPVQGGSENVTTRKRAEPTGSEVSQLTEQLKLLTVEFSSVKSKLEDLTQSLLFTHEKMNEVMLQIAATEDRLKNLEKRDAEVETLQITVLQLQEDLKFQAQLNLRNEIEIVGIPEEASENIINIVLVAARKIGAELESKDIDWATRVGPRRSPVAAALPEDGARLPRPIVVRFLRRSKRDHILKTSKSGKNITSADLGVAGVSRRAYFNERLTKENRVLFRDTRLRAKEHGYTFCWCSQGTIYVRQREGNSALPISSHRSLDRQLPPLAPPSSSL